MKKEYKAKIFVFFGAVYIIMVAALIYFFSYNTGIVIEEEQVTGENAVLLKVSNGSFHSIRDIELSYVDAGEKKKIGDIKLLLPNENKVFRFDVPDGISGTINLVANAPYHTTLYKEFTASFTRPFDFTQRITSPDQVFIGENANITFEICSNEKGIIDGVQIVEEHDPTFFDTDDKKTIIGIREDECKELNYTLHSIKIGETEVRFTITAGITTKELSKKIEVIR